MGQTAKMNKVENILLIGLVNIDEPNNGDTSHFTQLGQRLSTEFLLSTVTLGNEKKSLENQLSMIFHNNSLIRVYRWNVDILKFMRKLHRDKKIDHVHIRPSGLVFSHYFFALYHSITYSIEVNGLLAESLSSSKLYSLIKKLYQFILRRSKFILGSPGYMTYIHHEFKITGDKLVNAHLGFTEVPLNPTNSVVNLQTDANYFLFVGNIAKYQGLQYIVDAVIANANAARSNLIKVLIIGDGEIRDTLAKRVKEGSVEDVVEIRDRVSKVELEMYLNMGAIGLSPFSPNRGREGMISSLKTFDYLFHEMPILTSNMDELANYIVQHNLGWSIKCFDSTTIYNLMLTALREKDQVRASYSQNWPKLKGAFSWEKRFAKIIEKIK